MAETPDNPLYEWDASINSQVAYTANGLNQYTAVAANAYSYDGNGNLSGDGTTTYTYDPENRLISTSSSDPNLSNKATLRVACPREGGEYIRAAL